ncbi:hypothetical protein ILYODFUR_008644 [Ilyodon furcidens]|uniref:Uncharacterized protein n=1 Tax=Ilyodon furcidens TaxID=33524 RepID=A0ABV0U3R6_9TELE
MKASQQQTDPRSRWINLIEVNDEVIRNERTMHSPAKISQARRKETGNVCKSTLTPPVTCQPFFALVNCCLAQYFHSCWNCLIYNIWA